MNDREMSAIANDPARAAAIAAGLLKLPSLGLSDWERGFLDKVRTGTEVLSYRRRETLAGLMDRSTLRSEVNGYRASRQIQSLYEARCDLDEDDEAWVIRMHAKGDGVALTNGQWRRLFALMRSVGLIEQYVEV
jgi:hypothetical protein